jgi:ribosomal protein S11
MKKTRLVTWCTLLFSLSVHAQNFEWAKSFGAGANDDGQAIAVDASGNVYTAGKFQGTADFDPGSGTFNLSSAGDYDIFIQKLDASGNFLWAKSFGGNSIDFLRALTLDSSGNVYSTGGFSGTVDFDPGTGTANLSSAGERDVFIQKLDTSGNFVWAKSFGGSESEEGYSIAVDASGNILTLGVFENTVDFDPGAGTTNLSSTGRNDVFVQKLDPSGNLIWAKSFGNSTYDYGYAIAVDDTGNVYSAGRFQSTVDFDPGPGTFNLTAVASNSDAYIQKLDTSGNFVWARSFGGVSSDYVSDIAVDALGNVYTTGRFQGTADFDPGVGTASHSSAGQNDVFVHKLNTSGNFVWVKSYGGSSADVGQSITVDASGNVYTLGNFTSDTADFDPGVGIANLSSAGQYDVFIQKLDTSGNFVWAKSFGGSTTDFGISIAVDASGNVYTTGSFQGTADLDPGAGTANFSSNGQSDVFVQKLNQCTPDTGTDVQTACGSYIWIDGNTYTSSNNTATFTLTNASGCDSVVTLDLTINSVDITTSLTGLTITATNPNATYQWLNCDSNYAAISGETQQTFTATTNGNYAVELTENGCVDTSSCVSITTIGIVENDFGNGLLIYPNPTSGNFTIDLGASYENTQILITDLSGKVVQSQNVRQGQVLNLSIEEPAGIYVVSIQSGNQKAVIKMVKE